MDDEKKKELEEALGSVFGSLVEEKLQEATNLFQQALEEESGIGVQLKLKAETSLDIQFVPTKEKEDK